MPEGVLRISSDSDFFSTNKVQPNLFCGSFNIYRLSFFFLFFLFFLGGGGVNFWSRDVLGGLFEALVIFLGFDFLLPLF